MKRTVARRFGDAAASYDAHSAAQRHAAARLAERIAAAPLRPAPRVLEIGCGTGHLTALLAHRIASADFFCSDIAPAMVAACRARLPAPHYLVMDGERPALAGGFDLVCANLAAQWFTDLPAALARLAALLAPGGVLALSLLGSDTFGEWRAAHAALGLAPGTPDFPDLANIRAAFPPGQLALEEENHRARPASALDFLRGLRAIGADTPAPGHRPLNAGELRAVLRRLGDNSAVSYRLVYAVWSTQ